MGTDKNTDNERGALEKKTDVRHIAERFLDWARFCRSTRSVSRRRPTGRPTLTFGRSDNAVASLPSAPPFPVRNSFSVHVRIIPRRFSPSPARIPAAKVYDFSVLTGPKPNGLSTVIDAVVAATTTHATPHVTCSRNGTQQACPPRTGRLAHFGLG